MRVTADIELNNIPYDQDVHKDIAYLNLYLQQLFGVQVEVEIDDLDYTDKIRLAKSIKGSNA